MKNKGKTLFIIILAADLFLLSFVFFQNEIKREDTFVSSRSYGFPLPAFFITKNTESGSEAEEIYKLDTLDLLKNGWEIKTGSGINGFFPVIVVNFSFYLIISIVFVSVFNFFIFSLMRRVRGMG